jgi:hypothetical protein
MNRLAIAIGAAGLLVVIVAAVLVLGSGSDDATAVEAPVECVRAWNDDPAATSFGAHNYGFGHEYRDVRVSRRDPDGLTESDTGECAVVFGALALDQEPFAAGQLFRDGAWEPLSELEGVELVQVGELQAEAAASPNASLLPDGRLQAR